MNNTTTSALSESRFGTKEVIALLLLPLSLLLRYVFKQLPFIDNPWVSTLLSTGITLLVLGAILRLFGNVFKQDWQTFKQKKLNFLRCIIGFGVFFGILLLSKQAIEPFLLTTTNDLYAGSSLILMFIAALGPMAAPFIEEMVFRHLLVYKFRNCRKIVVIGMVLLSSILFGVMHYVNFNALLPTVPYMIVGAFFCGVYLFFKNIWFSTIIHFLFNTMNALGGAILLLFLSLTQG